MEFSPELAKQFRVAAAKPLAKVRRELAPGTMQPAARDLIGKQPPGQAKRERDLPERLRAAAR
jgi:hypothetical protein